MRPRLRTTPRVTVVEQPIHEIGAQATRLLLRRIAGDGRPAETTVLDQRLVERGSVAAPAR
ncbi:MAG: substrate-binding domain-containing protein [Microbacterium sp.]|uniref:substrate-binding domain-containing protein n=1 Tax=Microbacterium sp. TaxID=51671 RepID=UPI003BAE4C57